MIASLFEPQTLPRFSVVVEDPAWPERGGGNRSAQMHYPVMTVRQIVNLPVRHCLAADCHLWLWTTDTFLPDAFRVLEARGVEYKRSWAWVKHDGRRLQTGLGQYARACHEWLILGTKGKTSLPDPHHRPPSVIMAPRGPHSRKPDEAWSVIETVSAGRTGPRLELNARQHREGWTAVGHETSGTTIEQFLRPYAWGR